MSKNSTEQNNNLTHLYIQIYTSANVEGVKRKYSARSFA